MLEWLPWQDAAVVAGACATVTVAFEPTRPWWRRAAALWRVAAKVVPWTRELALMFVLYGLWQLAGDLSVSQTSGALQRGRDLWRWERDVGLPSEASAQRLVLGHPELVRLIDQYYAEVHVPMLGLALLWLWVRHRDCYRPVRNVTVAVTATALLIQLVPVAPPRLVPGLHIVDTGRVYGPDVYPDTVRPGLDQLSTMPSLHVGWALVVAGAVIVGLRSRWRWLAFLYPAATTFVVVVTGNHYWADAIVALVLWAASVAAVARIERWRLRRSADRSPAAVAEQRQPVTIG